ncbi:type II toxin-antitoxin system RelE/ParE family toxin [Flavobacterium sp. RHBU_24]|uniref:type II toxin-antitoxin system RelE/ParE family toxin n=1 Tax=Flavobacterium sp. RHBU_24 TaxID=3391185 RepID=UPI0039847164
MRVKLLREFSTKLKKQLVYIAEDKPEAARKFRADLILKLAELVSMPYKNRKSIHYKDDNIRDLVFKGYVIIYRIKPEQNEIEVFGFIKYTKEP